MFASIAPFLTTIARAGSPGFQPLRRVCALALLVATTAAATNAVPDDAPAAADTVDFERYDPNGRLVRLSDFRGRWVVVNFWASWCGPCVREIPMLRELHDSRGDVTVIGVNFEEIGDAELIAFIEESRMDYPVVRAGDEPLVPFEPLKGLPSTFVVSPAGELFAARAGEVDRAWIEKRLVSARPSP